MSRPSYPRLEDMDDEEQLFSYASLSAHTWTSTGLELWWAAVCARRGNLAHLLQLYPNGNWPPNILIQRPELMLKGMAAECMLKAIFLFAKQQNEEVTLKQIERLSWFNGHNLVLMAQAACFDVSDAEVSVLEILSQHIRWRGRYPTPREKNKQQWKHAAWHPLEHDCVWEEMWKRLNDRAHQWSANNE